MARSGISVSLTPDHSVLDGVGRLLVSCTDRPGIVAAISQFVRDRGANIVQSDQHTTDPEGGAFFMRTEFRLDGLEAGADDFERAFADEVGEPFAMDWQMHYASRRKRVAILVSRYDHCLAELLWRWRRGELYADIPLIVSNHPDLASEADALRCALRARAGRARRQAGGRGGAARAARRQVRPGGPRPLHADPQPAFLEAVRTPIINIHHSFLPAFAGADPYARAHERGVKIIGATAHYVTEELDAGPIIEQDVARVTHREGVDALVRTGADLERIVLLRAVRWHLEDRVLVHGNRTVVFL